VTVPNEPDKRVIRSTPTGRFVTLANVLVRDRRLKSYARGVLVELLSRHPDKRLPSADEYASEYGEGRDVIRKAYRDLKKVGYLWPDVRRRPDGRTITVLVVFDHTHQQGCESCTNAGISVVGVTRADTAKFQVAPTTRKPTVGEPGVKYLKDERTRKTKDVPPPAFADAQAVVGTGREQLQQPDRLDVDSSRPAEELREPKNEERTDEEAPDVPGQPVGLDAVPPSMPALDDFTAWEQEVTDSVGLSDGSGFVGVDHDFAVTLAQRHLGGVVIGSHVTVDEPEPERLPGLKPCRGCTGYVLSGVGDLCMYCRGRPREQPLHVHREVSA
jgi:hypothetical protein